LAVGELRSVLQVKGDPAALEALYREILAGQRAALGNDNLAVAETLSSLAASLYAQGNQADARKASREAMGVVLNLRDQDRAQLPSGVRELAEVLKSQGKSQDAEKLFEDAIDLAHQKLGETNLILGELLLDYGDFLFHQEGKLDAAEADYRQAIALYEKASAAFPNQAVLTGRLGTLNLRLVELLRRRGRLAEAKSMYPAVAERGSASELNAFAWLLATCHDPNLRDGTNAVVFAERAVAATKRKHVGYLDTLAAAYAETGQFAKAISIQQEAIALSQSGQEKRDLASRLKLYENNSPYRDHGALAELTRDRLREGRFAEAEGPARECLAMREREIPDDWRTFNARSMLGGSLLGQKKYAEAEPLLVSGYEGMKQREVNIPLEGKVRLSETLQRLVKLCEATSRPNQAAEWKQKLAELGKTEK